MAMVPTSRRLARRSTVGLLIWGVAGLVAFRVTYPHQYQDNAWVGMNWSGKAPGVSLRGKSARKVSLVSDIGRTSNMLGNSMTLTQLHRSTGVAHGNLGLAMQKEGQFAEAQREYESAISIMSEHLDPRHLGVGRLRWNLGTTLREMGEFTEAQLEYEAAIVIMSEYLGPKHPDVGVARESFDMALAEMGHITEAKRELERTISMPGSS